MDNNVVDINNLTDETKQKLRDFDEQEAYFLLCEIFANAQASKDYAKLQTDLAEWKKHYPIDLFSENLKRKIKYMLSKEFLDTILKDFTAFDELSKKDPAVGLEKLRKILDKAEKHKDKKQLDKDLDKLYKEYPLDFLKEKYPHIVKLLTSQANIDKVLQKFDSDLAYDELIKITEHPEEFKNFDEYKNVLEEYQKNFPVDDFSDKYKSQVQTILNENLDEKKAAELFSISYFDLSNGEVVDLNLTQNFSLLERNARTEFFKIVDNNIDNIPALYDWTCKYARYINSFDINTKNTIVSSLMKRYYHELPTLPDYRIPELNDFDDDLSIEDSINDINKMKKDTVIQLLGILSTGNELSKDDCIRLNSNNKQIKEIAIKSIDYELFNFMENKEEEELTFDKNTSLYLNPTSSSSGAGGASPIATLDNNVPEISGEEIELQNSLDKEPEQVIEQFPTMESDSKEEPNQEENTELDVQPELEQEQKPAQEIQQAISLEPKEESKTEVQPIQEPENEQVQELECEQIQEPQPEHTKEIKQNLENEQEENIEPNTESHKELEQEPKELTIKLELKEDPATNVEPKQVPVPTFEKEPEPEIKVKNEPEKELNQPVSQEPSSNDVEIKVELETGLNKSESKTNEYKKGSAFGKIWDFLNRDISNKRQNNGFERDDDER